MENNNTNSEVKSDEMPAEAMEEPMELTGAVPYSVKSFDANDIDKSFAQLIRLSQDKIFHEPSCCICSSAIRNELEDEWLKEKKHKAVKDLAKTKANLSLSNDIIDNHMRTHYGRGIGEIKRLEYLDTLRRVNSVELTTSDRVQVCLAALTERIMAINGLVPNSTCDEVELEKIKTDALVKTMASFEKFIKLQATMRGEMQNSGELIILPSKAFVQVFNDVILEAQSEEAKNTIKKLLVKLTALSKLTQ